MRDAPCRGDLVESGQCPRGNSPTGVWWVDHQPSSFEGILMIPVMTPPSGFPRCARSRRDARREARPDAAACSPQAASRGVRAGAATKRSRRLCATIRLIRPPSPRIGVSAASASPGSCSVGPLDAPPVGARVACPSDRACNAAARSSSRSVGRGAGAAHAKTTPVAALFTAPAAPRAPGPSSDKPGSPMPARAHSFASSRRWGRRPPPPPRL